MELNLGLIYSLLNTSILRTYYINWCGLIHVSSNHNTQELKICPWTYRIYGSWISETVVETFTHIMCHSIFLTNLISYTSWPWCPSLLVTKNMTEILKSFFVTGDYGFRKTLLRTYFANVIFITLVLWYARRPKFDVSIMSRFNIFILCRNMQWYV